MLRALLLCATMAAPSKALACSCKKFYGPLSDRLQARHADTAFIYLARVISAESNATSSGVLEVAEVFKGALERGQLITLEPIKTSCDIELLADNELLLMYSNRVTAPFDYCSASRSRVSDSDPEVRWLRTHILPPEPTVAIRQSISCTRCDALPMVRSLTGQSEAARRVDRRDVLDGGQPFWVQTFSKNLLDQTYTGRAKDGRPFMLTLTFPSPFQRHLCRSQITRQWCDALNQENQSSPQVRCVNPGPAETMCDEPATRQSPWGRLENAPGYCRWAHPTYASCAFTDADGGTPRLRSPVMRCTPGWNENAYDCTVVELNADGGVPLP